mmetsp:Transcript_86305/g.252501  ORF Transcript_86305/g.252501 Transcript_86305/m.252501 type:complete len:815 (+) Transcript_86305:48-2492(+)
MARRHVLVAVAALVCLVAVVVQLSLSSGISEHVSFGAVGNLLFSCLETDVVGFALPAAYFRVAVPGSADESLALRLTSAAVVGAAAFANIRLWEEGRVDSFALVLGVLAASYVFSCKLCPGTGSALVAACASGAALAWIVTQGWLGRAAIVASGFAVAHLGNALFAKLRASGRIADSSRARWSCIVVAGVSGLTIVPVIAIETVKFLLPIRELAEAYALVGTFIGVELRDRLALKLLVVTAFCQVSLGYLGIAFLRKGQTRKNALISVGEGRVTARGYAHLVVIYMVAAALPYMLQRTVVENVNSYVAGRIEREVERSIRITSFFPKGSSGPEDLLLGAIHGSKFTVEAYTDAFNSIVSVMFNAVELKLFTLPKLMLLPSMLVNQPWLVVSVLPGSIVLDVGRARMITAMTRRIEALSRQIQELANRRRKIEQHDAKNEELIRRGASSAFAESAWRELAGDLEAHTLRYHSLTSLRAFVNALYKQDFLGPGIELVLAWLLEFRQIPLSDIWVYTRVVEDSIDFLLTRFRMDATLATLKTNMDRVTDLSKRLAKTRARGRATCSVVPAGGVVRIAGLRYTRGAVLEVHLPDLVLRAGRIYAVTGANGSGKSSLFGVLASCGKAATMLPDGMKLLELESLELPSDDVVEITQQLYCPLYVKPLAWMLQRRDLDSIGEEELQIYEKQIGKLSSELEFHRKDDLTNGQDSGLTHDELDTETEDWYGMLSGGQRGKVEFIRKVFLRDRCPGVLLIDEAFAPLDPKSKQLVQQKLKEFCADSVILVIYHGGASENCVPSDNFFDESVHFSNGTATLVPTC